MEESEGKGVLLRSDDGRPVDIVVLIPVRVAGDDRELPVHLSSLIHVVSHLLVPLSAIMGIADSVTLSRARGLSNIAADQLAEQTQTIGELLDYLSTKARPSKDLLDKLEFHDIGDRALTEWLRTPSQSGGEET